MPERVFDVGISEGHAVTFAGGLAKEGLHPFVAIYSSFLQRSYDQIIHDVAIQRLPVTFCIDRAGLVGEDGVTHHGIFDIAYLRAVPGLVVASPRDEEALRNLMFTASRYNAPMAVRYPRGKGSMTDWHTPLRLLEIGKGEKLSDGRDVAVISSGPIASEVSEAIARLEAEGVSVAHYDMTLLKPLPVVTVEDGTVIGGLGSAVADYLTEKGRGDIPLHKLGVPDCFIAQGTVAQLRHLCGIDAEAIADAVREIQLQTLHAR